MDIQFNDVISWATSHWSEIAAVGGVVWSGFNHFDNRHMKKKIEKIKLLNQQDLETFKLYIKQKNEAILSMYSAFDAMIGVCLQLHIFPCWEGIDLETCSEESFVWYLRNRNITGDREIQILLHNLRGFRASGSRNLNLEMEGDLRVALNNTYAGLFREMMHQARQARLFLSPIHAEIVLAFSDKLRETYNCVDLWDWENFRELTEDQREARRADLKSKANSLAIQFTHEIIPILKEELWDETKNGK